MSRRFGFSRLSAIWDGWVQILSAAAIGALLPEVQKSVQKLVELCEKLQL